LNKATGNHCILELYECPFELLDDEQFIRRTLNRAAEASGSTLLALTSHKFSPQGVTALGLLAESHISIHTWPETGYVAADVFTCGTHCDPLKACRLLVERLRAGRHCRSVMQRGPAILPRATRSPEQHMDEDTCPQMHSLSPYG